MKNFFFCIFLIWLTIFSSSSNAQHKFHKKKFDQVLNADGTIKKGFKGSFNPKGYRMELDKKGQPLFKPSSVQKTNSTAVWSSLGSGRTGILYRDGTPGVIYAIAVNSAGHIYVGGDFSFAGDLAVNYIAKWNGSSWSALTCGSSNGVNDCVNSILINGTDVYVGGDFTRLGNGTSVKHVAKWNEGTGWSALTDITSGFNGVNGSIYDIVINGSGDLYVGGEFTVLGNGSTSANNIAKWDGSNWSAVTGSSINGIGGTVITLMINGSKVYAAGYFSTLGDGLTTANNIAVWDETANRWSALLNLSQGINGLSGIVYDIAILGTSIYTCGAFTTLGDGTSPANYIAKFDEAAGWSALISGTNNGLNNYVWSVMADGTDIYVGGEFTGPNDGSALFNYVAKLTGTSWSALSGTGFNGVGEEVILALAVKDNNIFTGGCFLYLGDNTTPANSIAIWNKSTPGWSTIGSGDNGVDDQVLSIAVDGNDVYVGGDFTTINGGSIPAVHIAKWNNTTGWSTLPGIDKNDFSYIDAIAVNGGNIYAAGYFTSINSGTSASSIAMWNGTAWSALSVGINNGVDGDIYAIAVDGNDIYIGGDFTALSGGGTANYVAKWNGSSWTTLTSGSTNGVSSNVNCITVNGDNIYFGGDFENLVCWNSSSETWINKTPSEGYYADGIYSLALYGGEIYAACDLYDAFNIVASIAKWDNTNNKWLLVGSGGPAGDVTSIVPCNSDLYVVSVSPDMLNFTYDDCISKWNGTAWETLTDGTSDGTNLYINTMAVSETEGKMYVGGFFSIAGENTTAFNIASFTDSDNPLPIELNSFTAEVTANNVLLKWRTATEVDNYGFEVERQVGSLEYGVGRQKSEDRSQRSEVGDQQASSTTTPGQGWERVGFVEGAGNSNSPKEYSFVDYDPVGTRLNVQSTTYGVFLQNGAFMHYRLKQIDTDGKFTYSEDVEVNIKLIPTEYSLEQNYPNPFNPSTTIEYALAFNSRVRVEIYNTLGELAAILVNKDESAGIKQVIWNADNYPSGIYIMRMSAETVEGEINFSSVKKLILLK